MQKTRTLYGYAKKSVFCTRTPYTTSNGLRCYVTRDKKKSVPTVSIYYVHFLCKFLPIIDEHNKQRQSILAIEHKWQTSDCWFRLLTTMLGFSIVDMHRWYRNMKAWRFTTTGPSYRRTRNMLQNIFTVENE